MGNEILKDFSSRKGPEPQGQMDAGGRNIPHSASALTVLLYGFPEGARKKRTINWGLETIGMHSLTVLRLVVQCRCIRRAMFPLQDLGGVFPWLFLASGARWQSLVFLGLETHHFNLCLFRPVISFLGRSVCPHRPFLI